MLETIQSLSLLTVAEIIGPIALGIALIYGVYHTRRSRRTEPNNTKGTIYAQDRE